MKNFKKSIRYILIMCLILAPLGLVLNVFADDDNDENPEVFEQEIPEEPENEGEPESNEEEPGNDNNEETDNKGQDE